jgi:hypothetical protein
MLFFSTYFFIYSPGQAAHRARRGTGTRYARLPWPTKRWRTCQLPRARVWRLYDGRKRVLGPDGPAPDIRNGSSSIGD